MRIILLLLLITGACAVGPMLSMTRRMYYSRAQYLLPCDICINALKYHSYSPSHTFGEFQKKINGACHHATSEAFAYQACTAILKKYSHPLLKDQMTGVPFQKSCVSTFNTNCVASTANFTVFCDQRKKKGFCQVIPI
jgi:hypothetical protein